MDAQRTLRRTISCAGIGLHSGKKVTLSLKPAPADFGIRFRRTDLGGLEIPANVGNLGGIQYATGLTRDEGTVDTIEHLFVVPSSSVHRIQEAQTSIYHVLWELVQHELGARGRAAGAGL